MTNTSPPRGVPLAPGAYTDAQGKIWLVEDGRFGRQWRVPGGLLIRATNPSWPSVLETTNALPFRRMAPVRKKI